MSDDEVPIPELPGIDTSTGLAIAQNNTRLYRKLLLKFRDGHQDFDRAFIEALDSDDATEATRVAHTLKGVAGNVGAKAIQEAAAALEEACRDHRANEELKLLIQKVVNELAPVFDGIALLMTDDKVVAAKEQEDPEKKKALLGQLRDLLEDDDADALDVLDELEALPGPSTDKASLKKLSKAVSEYDFELALEELKKIEEI